MLGNLRAFPYVMNFLEIFKRTHVLKKKFDKCCFTIYSQVCLPALTSMSRANSNKVIENC